MYLMTSLFVLLPTFISAQIPTPGAITGGSVYEKGRYPFLVSMWATTNSKQSHSCAGILIQESWVLSTAHCYNEMIALVPKASYPTSWKALLGLYNQSNAANEAIEGSIEAIFPHPDFNTTTAYADIALLKLTKPVPLGATVNIAELAKDAHCPKPNDAVDILGWGWTGTDKPQIEILPRIGTVRVYHSTDCKQQILSRNNTALNNFSTGDGALCAGTKQGGVDFCNKDEGGPLLAKCGNQQVVAGIASVGFPTCAMPDIPSIYTRISYFQKWIEETMQG